jgi:signal transduction histidine kinase
VSTESKADHEIIITHNQYFYPEKDQLLGLNDLAKTPEYNWQPAKSNYGFTPFPIYTRTIVKVKSSTKQNLTVSLPMLADYGEIWVTEGSNLIAHSLSGAYVPLNQWTGNYTFTSASFETTGEQVLTIYAAVKHAFRIIAVPTVTNTSQKFAKENDSLIIWHMFLGGALLLCFHVIGQFIMTKEKVFLSYLLYLFTMTFSLAGVWGSTSSIIARIAPEYGDKIRVIYAFTSFAIIQIVESYLEKQNLSSKVSQAVHIFKIIAFFTAFFAFFDASSVMSFSAALSTVLVVLTYAAAISAIKNKHVEGWFIIAAFAPPSIFYMINHIILISGHEPPTREFFTVGFMLELWVMSFALSEKNRRKQQHFISAVEDQNARLENAAISQSRKVDQLKTSIANEIRKNNETLKLVEEKSKIIAEQKEKLQIAEHSQVVSNLSIGVSHEINNPLAIAQGNVYVIERNLKSQFVDDHPTMVAVKNLHQSILRISHIVKSLRDFTEMAKPQILAIESADKIYSLIPKTIVNDARISIPINIEFNSLDCFIKVDLHALNKIITALLSNSANAVQNYEQQWIIFSSKVQNSFIEMKFVDSGEGIPASIAMHMFEPFYSTGETTSHKGLGLPSARILAESMGGSLNYDFKSQHTTFVLLIPILANENLSAS